MKAWSYTSIGCHDSVGIGFGLNCQRLAFHSWLHLHGNVLKLGVAFLGVPITRTVVFWVYIRVPFFWETTTYTHS